MTEAAKIWGAALVLLGLSSTAREGFLMKRPKCLEKVPKLFIFEAQILL
jgi:hypothetical protein